jgi:hypothetical protein
MLRRSTRAAIPRSVEDSPVPLTSENRFTDSIRPSRNVIGKGKQRQRESSNLWTDVSSSSESNASSPAFKGIEIRSEFDSEDTEDARSERSNIRRSTRAPAPRRSNGSPVPLTSEDPSFSNIHHSIRSSTSSTTSHLPQRKAPITMRGGQRSSTQSNYSIMVSDESSVSSRESSVEFVSATYVTQPPPKNTQKGASGSRETQSTALIKNEKFTQGFKAKSGIILPDKRPIIKTSKGKSTGRAGAANEESVESTVAISGAPDWLSSTSSQTRQQEERPTVTENLLPISRTPLQDSSSRHSARSSSRESVSDQDATQGQASFVTAIATQAQSMRDQSFRQSNVDMTQSASGRPRPRSSSAAIASSLNSPSKNGTFATQSGTRPKPRPSTEAVLASTQSRPRLLNTDTSSAQDAPEEEDIPVTQPLAISTESTSHPLTEQGQDNATSSSSNSSNEDIQADKDAPPSTMLLRSRQTKRKRSPSVITIHDSPSPSPPAKRQGATQGVQLELPNKRGGRSTLTQVPESAAQPEPPKRGRGRPKKVQNATVTKKKPSKQSKRPNPLSKRSRKKLPTFLMEEREQAFFTAPPPLPSPEAPSIQSSIRPPPRRKRRRSSTPEEEEELMIPLTFAAETPPPPEVSRRDHTIKPIQSQRPRPRARQIDSDDEPEKQFETAPDASESLVSNRSVSPSDHHVDEDQDLRDDTLSDPEQGDEDQDLRDDTLSDLEQDRSGSTVIQDRLESNSQDDNERGRSLTLQVDQQEAEVDSDAEDSENVADATITEKEHGNASQSIAPIEEQSSRAIIERAESDTPAPLAEETRPYREEQSSSSSPPHSSSPPSSASSYESALETQRRTTQSKDSDIAEREKEATQKDVEGRLKDQAETREIAQPVQLKETHRLLSSETDGKPLKIHVPMTITDRESLLDLIRSNGAHVCNRVEQCDMVLVDDELLESENNTFLTVIRQATKGQDQKSLIRRAWLVDSVEEGKALNRTDAKYAISKEQIQSIKARHVPRLYNTVPDQSAETLASRRLVPGSGGQVRVAFTEMDAVQIIGHLAITKEAWDGMLCAKELQKRFKRHTWMSYQSHIRDNLNKNKHYGDRARDYQKKIGQERQILDRRKMQEELNGIGME